MTRKLNLQQVLLIRYYIYRKKDFITNISTRKSKIQMYHSKERTGKKLSESITQKQYKLQQNYLIIMKSQVTHEHHRIKGGSSNHRLPLIQKYFPIKNNSKQTITKYHIPFQIFNQFQKHQNLPKNPFPNITTSNKSSNITSFRVKTNTINRTLIKQQHNKSRGDYDGGDQNKSENKQLVREHFNRGGGKNRKQYIRKQIKKNNEEKNKQIRENIEVIKIGMGRMATEEDEIFSDIKEIIKSKMPKKKTIEETQRVNLSHVQHVIKLVQINKSLKKLSPEKSLGDLKKSIEGEVKQITPLKDETNYHEWRRVDLNSTLTLPRYTYSTFDIENKRLSDFVTKNSVSLSNYLQLRNEFHIFKQNPSIKSEQA